MRISFVFLRIYKYFLGSVPRKSIHYGGAWLEQEPRPSREPEKLNGVTSRA